MHLLHRLCELILTITNIVYLASGVTVLIIGALILGSPSAVINLMSFIPQIDDLSKIMDFMGVAVFPGIYLTCKGSIVIILSILGCGGIYKKSTLVVSIYGVSTMLMMLFNIAIIMFYIIDPYFIEDNVKHNMNKTLKEKFQPLSFQPDDTVTLPTEESALAWVTMQFEQGCCGVESYEDYGYFTWNKTVPRWSTESAVVPPSCCSLRVPYQVATVEADFVNGSACVQTASEFTNRKGCSDYVMQLVTRYNIVYSLTATAFTGLQAIILCLTMWMITSKDDVDYA